MSLILGQISKNKTKQAKKKIKSAEYHEFA
jgi:hypothetical protein